MTTLPISRRWLAGLLPMVCTTVLAEPALQVERVPLDEDARHQTYNFQQQGDLRVWARSGAGFKASQIRLQRRVQGRWLPPETWAQADARWRDSDPFLGAGGKALLFISDRPGPTTPSAPPSATAGAPRGQLDLFEAAAADAGSAAPGQSWATPRRLAESLQSPQYELGPERHGGETWFGSYRPGGPGPLSIYRTLSSDTTQAPEPVAAPVNDAGHNSDPTLSPDGRYLLWWSDRSGRGDLYLAERLGADRFGPALRLPAAVNDDQAFEFTPWVGDDGEWLYFASTRPDTDAASGGARPAATPGLARTYRVKWAAVLQALGPAATQASDAALGDAVSAFWRALSHGPEAAADVAALRRLLHPQARVWGSGVRERQARLLAQSGEQLVQDLVTPEALPMQECEVAREVHRHGTMAQVHSRVRTDRGPGQVSYTGVNSLQWHLGPQGWQLLSLHFALEAPGLPLSGAGACR